MFSATCLRIVGSRVFVVELVRSRIDNGVVAGRNTCVFGCEVEEGRRQGCC